MRSVLVFLGLMATALMALAGLATLAKAQYPAPQYPDAMRRFFERTDNPPLNCSVERRIGRDGDIVWLQMTCRAER